MTDEDTPRLPKVAVGIPSHGEVSSLTTHSLARMMMQAGAGAAHDLVEQVGVYMVTNTYIHRAREELAEQALKVDATHILWIDADMTFPQDALFRLLQHDKDIVGVNYSKRGLPPEFTAAKHIDWETDEDSEKLVTASDSTGLEEVDGIGFGLVLMKTHVFNRLASERPWFWYEQKDYGHVGEDTYFCKLAQDVGISIYVDHDLSKQCSHVGEFEYMPIHAEDAMTADESEIITEV